MISGYGKMQQEGMFPWTITDEKDRWSRDFGLLLIRPNPDLGMFIPGTVG